MKKYILFIGGILIVILGTFIYTGVAKSQENGRVESTQSNISEEADPGPESPDPIVKQMGAVEVEVVPQILAAGENMVFKLFLNTHSVDLNHDYTQVISAQDDLGNTYKVLNWTGGQGGHHLSGEVEFIELSEEASKIIINIDGIDDRRESFEWEL